MKILFINHYAGGPDYGMAFRSHYLAQEWCKLGHEVTIIGASFSHLRRQNPTIQGLYTKETIDKVDYIWCKTPPYKGNGLGRFKNIITFLQKLYGVKSQLGDKAFDCVIASSTYPLDIYPASYLAKHYQAKLVWEVHDLWPLSPMLLGNISPYHPFMMLLQRGENDACKRADAVVSILPHADKHLIKQGLDPSKYNHVPNGIVHQEWDQEQTTNLPKQLQEEITTAQTQGKFIVGYAGSHGPSNGMDYLLTASKTLRDHPFKFILVGSGSEKATLEEQARAQNLENISFHDPIPKTSIPAFLKQMDCLYLGFRALPLYQYGIGANKIFDYLMSSRPIIFGSNASNDPIKDARAGISIPPDDANALTKALITMRETSDQQREQMGLNGQKFVKENHDYRQLAKDFLQSLK